jgi:hypothetical protein
VRRPPQLTRRRETRAYATYLEALKDPPVLPAAPAPVPVRPSPFTELVGIADGLRASWGSSEHEIASAARCLKAAVDHWDRSQPRQALAQVARALRALERG